MCCVNKVEWSRWGRSRNDEKSDPQQIINQLIRSAPNHEPTTTTMRENNKTPRNFYGPTIYSCDD